MAAKLHELEYFPTINQMDRAFSDTSGELAVMKLGFSPKKPDKAKVQDMLDKDKKNPGKFYLVLDGTKLTFEVRVGAAKLVLNTLDLNTIKDIGKKRELMSQLNRHAQDLVSKDDLKKFDETHTEPENPTVQKASVELGKEIDEMENELENLKITRDAPNYKKKDYSEWDKEFNDWVKAKGFGRFTSFLEEAQQGGLGPEGAKLLADPKTSGIQVKTLEAIKAAQDKGDKPDYTQARKEVIANVMNKLLLPRYNQEKMGDLNKRVTELTNKLAPLKKKLEALETK